MDRSAPEQKFRDNRVDVLLGIRGQEGDRALTVRQGEDLARTTSIEVIGNVFADVVKALAADVAMPVSGTWYDGPAIPLTKGVWLVTATLQHQRTDASGGVFAGRLLRDAAVICGAQGYHPAVANAGACLSVTSIIRVTGNVIVKAQMRTGAGAATAFLAATAPYAGAQPASLITATRMRLLP